MFNLGAPARCAYSQQEAMRLSVCVHGDDIAGDDFSFFIENSTGTIH